MLVGLTRGAPRWGLGDGPDHLLAPKIHVGTLREYLKLMRGPKSALARTLVEPSKTKSLAYVSVVYLVAKTNFDRKM